jgi:hypothetical protein
MVVIEKVYRENVLQSPNNSSYVTASIAYSPRKARSFTSDIMSRSR